MLCYDSSALITEVKVDNKLISIYSRHLYKELSCKSKAKWINYLCVKCAKTNKMFFSEILCAIKSSLGQLAAFVSDFLPVGLANDKADSALSVCVLLLL